MAFLSSFLRNALFVAVAYSSFKEKSIFARADNIYSWTPSVSLTENFGVDDGLCIDIAGFGSGLNCNGDLQLHTCKSAGADTQFYFEAQNLVPATADFILGYIKAVNYNLDCVEISDDDEQNACLFWDGEAVQLRECGQGVGYWAYFKLSTELHSVSGFGTGGAVDFIGQGCLAKSGDVGNAGPFKRADLAVVDCESANPFDKSWTITPLPQSQTGTPTTKPTFAPTNPTTNGDSPTMAPTTSASPTAAPTPATCDFLVGTCRPCVERGCFFGRGGGDANGEGACKDCKDYRLACKADPNGFCYPFALKEECLEKIDEKCPKTETPTAAPTIPSTARPTTTSQGECFDADKTFKFDVINVDKDGTVTEKKRRDCDWVKNQEFPNLTKKICRRDARVRDKSDQIEKVSVFCPRTCDICPDQCRDSRKSFDIANGPANKKCSFVSDKDNVNTRTRLCRNKKVTLRGKKRVIDLRNLCLDTCGRLGFGRCATFLSNPRAVVNACDSDGLTCGTLSTGEKDKIPPVGTEWPDLLNKTVDEAVEFFQSEYPGADLILIKVVEGSFVTQDIQDDRVRLWVDVETQNTIVEIPRVG